MLEIENIARIYPAGQGKRAGLSKVDLSVGQHEIVALVGTSGCGKSTLLRLTAGLERPDAGEIRLDGQRVTGPRPEIGMVFQEPRLLSWLTVRENIRLALLDLPRVEQGRRIDEALSKVGLERFAEAWPRQLSGGMAQRVAIARALVRKPSVLLLDEPFSALDSFTRLGLQEHLLSLWAESSFTVILVTHDVEEAVALSDRVVVLRGQPGEVEREIGVSLPLPRSRTGVEFQALKARILAALDLSETQAAGLQAAAAE